MGKESALTPKTISENSGVAAKNRCLRPNAPELESGLGLNNLTVHLQKWIHEEINRAAFRFRIDYQVATLRHFKSVRRIVTEIIVGQLRVFPRFADVHRNPLTVGEKFGPAMVTLDLAFILVGWNGRADGETRRYVDASRQSNEVCVKIRAVSGASITRVDPAPAPPTVTRFIVAHAADDVIV